MTQGLIGILGVLLGISMQRTLDWVEKQRESRRQRLALARALLFEIVSFYRYYYTYLRPLLQDLDPQTCLPPTVSAPTAEFFTVYRGNAGKLGELDVNVVELVVRFYGLAEWLLATIEQYRASLEDELKRQGSVVPTSGPRKLLKQVQTTMWETDRAAVETGRKLADLTRMSEDPFAKLN